MAKVSVQTPTYVKLDLQSRSDREDTRDPPLFSLELDDEASRACDDDKTFLPLLGAARKAALPMIAISAVGWILFVLGFDIYRNRYMYVGGITDYPELYWAWTGCIVGPVAYLLALIHAFMWRKASSAVGSVTALLGMVYTATLGYGLITCGLYTYESFKQDDDSDELSVYGEYPEYVGLMFAGSFLACLFWGLTVALWPWYEDAATEKLKTSHYKQMKDGVSNV